MFRKNKTNLDYRIGFTPRVPPQFNSVGTARAASDAARAAVLQYLELTHAEFEAPLMFADLDGRWAFLEPDTSYIPDHVDDELFLTLYKGALSHFVTQNKIERYVVATQLATTMDDRRIDVLGVATMWDGTGQHEFYELQLSPRPRTVGDALKNPGKLAEALEGSGVFPMSAPDKAIKRVKPTRKPWPRKQS